MAESRATTLRALVVLSFLLTPASADAHVQLYQIVRLISFKSDCQLATLDQRPTRDRSLLFLATCENVSFYPDGLTVTCSDLDDDRSCTVQTAAKSFDGLHLLDRK